MSDSKQPTHFTSDDLKMSSKPLREHAYVWLLMKGDTYLPGIFTSVFSVARTSPAADLVVMVTHDVSQTARSMLLNVATHICEIPYINYESKKMKTQRQREMYESWIASSYTKWNALALPYKKIILIDGDTVHTSNTDELFSLSGPAMPYSSPFMEPMGGLPSYYEGTRGLDGYPFHASEIPIDVIEKTLNKGGILPTSTPAVIEPDADDYVLYQKTISAMQPFGFPKCDSGFDEQSIAYFYTKVKNKSYTSIHQRYNYYPWKVGFLFPGDVPKIIHFFSDNKPWMMKFNTYPDVITWYKMAALGLEKYSLSPVDIKLKKENVDGAKSSDDKFIKTFIEVDDVTQVTQLTHIDEY